MGRWGIGRWGEQLRISAFGMRNENADKEMGRWGDREVGRTIADFGIRNAELKNLEGKRHKAQGKR